MSEPNNNLSENKTQSVLDNTWSEVKINIKDLPKLYSQLSKQNLTSMLF